MEQPSSELRMNPLRMERYNELDLIFSLLVKSTLRPTPPVKSTSASSVQPPSSASYDPCSLQNSNKI